MWERYNITGQQAMADGRSKDAESQFKLALGEAEKLGAMDPKVATSLVNLANCFRQQGKYLEAEPLYRRALDIRKKKLGQFHNDLVVILDNYAKLLRAAGRESEAVQMETKAQEIFSKQ